MIEESRGLGVGKALFAELGKIAEEKVNRTVFSASFFIFDEGCARLDWAVLKWNQPSIDFYERTLGAKAMSEWVGMRLEGEGISALKKFRPDKTE